MSISGDFSALVALRAKPGEFDAIAEWGRGGRVPNFQVLWEFQPEGRPDAQLFGVEQAVRSLHTSGGRVMVDATHVRGQPGFVKNPRGALGELADRLAHPPDLFSVGEQVHFVPVVHADAPVDEAAELGRLCRQQGLGGALRVRLPGHHAEIGRCLDVLRVETSQLDLIVDAGYVTEVTSKLVDRVAECVRLCEAWGAFRTVALLSGSIPRRLGRTFTWEQHRYEEELWRSVVGAGSAELRYGDFGVVHPNPGPGGRTKHIALKYSCSGRWRYAREPCAGRGSADGDESARISALRDVCRFLIDSGDFFGDGFSWGDREIGAAVRGGGERLGWSSKPVAVATSHHLAYLALHSQRMT